MSTATRVTLTGTRRRADVVLPSQIAIGALLPDALQLLDEPPNVQPSALVVQTPEGEIIGPEQSLAEAGVVDGAVLRVTSQADSWSAAVILDVTDAVAVRTTSRWEQWLAPTQQLAACGAVVGSLVLAAWLLREAAGPIGVLFLLAGIAVAAGCSTAVVSLRRTTEPLSLAGIGAGLLVTGDVFGGEAQLLWLGLLVGVFGAAVALARGAVVALGIGLAVLVALGGTWFVLERAGRTDGEIVGIVMTISVLALGVLPQIVLTLSGLARLDDRVVDGAEVASAQVDRALRSAHRAVLLGVVAAVAVFLAAGLTVGLQATRWSLAVLLVASIAVLLRARTFPLMIARLACVAGPLLVLGAQLLRLAGASGASGAAIGCALAVGALGLVALCWTPSAYVVARGRLAVDRVEAVVTVALVPLVVGSFGVFGRLLRVFS